ncbi:hypothetical protein GCM10009804_20510 [Kribbella hippodromi]|uniref:DUF4240 domain-containing protein n=1 Tax=Kribbella hippodromi TaxID=434347 RepID=A0ABN2CV00_9ACTN
MTDMQAGERLLARLLAAQWDDEEAEQLHFGARRRLASEFFRRKAVWADALGITRLWPFADIALAFDPATETDPAWLERLEAGVGRELLPAVRKVVTDMFRWQSLGERPYERFPEFDDPYEPMVQVFELGGEFMPGQGGIDIYIGPVPYLDLAARLAQPPIPIDPATLAALDETDRAEVERARTAQREQQWSGRPDASTS